VSIYRWVQRFTSQLVDAARPSRDPGGDRWFVDETYVVRHEVARCEWLHRSEDLSMVM
jgi:transposase-like protein